MTETRLRNLKEFKEVAYESSVEKGDLNKVLVDTEYTEEVV